MRKNLILPLIGIIFLGAFLRLYGISDQPPLSDEVRVAFSAVHYMEDGQFGPIMWYHPNLRNILIYRIGDVLGYSPYALRGMSLLAGILSIPLTGILLYVLTKNKTASLLSAFLVSVEQVHITFSRQAIQETWTTFFFLLGILFAVLYFKRESASPPFNSPLSKGGHKGVKEGLGGLSTLILILSGIAFGLGIASKFHAIPPLIIMLFTGFYLSWKESSFSKGIFILSCLIFIPLIIYLLTYIPWFGRGYGIADWFEMQKVLFSKMMTHAGNPMDQVVDTQAWQWFLRPMGYANFVHFGDMPFVTVAFSNPFVWLLVLPSTLFVTWRHVIKRSPEHEEKFGIVFLLLLFVFSYLPLAVSPRPIWLLSSLAVLPFAFMIVSLAVSEWTGAVKWDNKALLGYIVITLLSSLALYPMAVGKGKYYGYLNVIVERFRPPFEKMR